jgi:hypothetical protein
MAVVLSAVKWLTASVVVLWHTRQGKPISFTCLSCSPETKLLYCVVPKAWQVAHWTLTSIVPVRQLGVVIAPWQLTLAQVRAVLSKDGAPDLAMYVTPNAASPGGTLSASFPARALARS